MEGAVFSGRFSCSSTSPGVLGGNRNVEGIPFEGLKGKPGQPPFWAERLPVVRTVNPRHGTSTVICGWPLLRYGFAQPGESSGLFLDFFGDGRYRSLPGM